MLLPYWTAATAVAAAAKPLTPENADLEGGRKEEEKDKKAGKERETQKKKKESLVRATVSIPDVMVSGK